jgi:hypothetical protein
LKETAMRNVPWILMLLTGLLHGEVDRSPKPWKIDFTLSLAEKEGKWIFAVDGATDLPKETVLRARVYAVTLIDHPFEGQVEDEEPLVTGDDPVQPSWRKFAAKGGKFRENVYSFKRKPYSIAYRARVFYVPEDQTDAVTLKVGNDEFSRPADLRFGTDEEYEKELKARQDQSVKDLQYLEGSTSELDGWIPGIDADPKGWSTWKTRTLDTLAALQKRNEEGFALWSVPPSRLGRMVVGGLCHYFERTVEAVDERAPGTQLRVRIRKLLEGIDDAYDQMGMDAPLEIKRATPFFEAYERSVAPLREGFDQVDVRRRVRADGVAALFDLLTLIRARQRTYVHLNALSVKFTRVFQLIDAGAAPEQVKEAVEAHEAALRDFRRRAGLQ